MVAIHDSDIRTIVDQLYGSMLDDALLSDALQSISTVLGQRRAMLLSWTGGISDLPDIAATCSVGGHTFDSFLADYGAYYHQLDPMKFKWDSVRQGDWAHEDHHANARLWSRSEFHQDFALRQGVSSWSVLKVLDNQWPQAHPAWALSVLCEAGDPALDYAVLQQVNEQISPHLQRTLSMRTTLANLRRMAHVGCAALDRCGYPIWIVDKQARVFFANTAADTHMRRASPALSVQAGRLAPRDAGIAKDWNEMVALSVPAAQARAAGMRLHCADGTSAVLQCLALPASAAGDMAAGASMRMVILNDQSRPPQAGELLIHLYGLTAAEVRVGQFLLLDLTVAEIAERCCITAETVRSHLKAVLRKTGCRRQAEVVRLLLSLETFGAR